ncbi:MAG: AAA family ATPase [Candidatus Dojkabacteria bacterium]|nr:AAA family ATPase [Candidatus Dojkabacteria bacterium]
MKYVIQSKSNSTKNIYCDLVDVYRYRGEYQAVIYFDKFFSKIIFIITFVNLVLFFVFYFSKSLIGWLITLFGVVYGILYYFYLRRDRNLFDNKGVPTSFAYDIQVYNNINLADYFSLSFKVVLDKYFGAKRNRHFDADTICKFFCEVICAPEISTFMYKVFGITNIKPLLNLLDSKKFEYYKKFSFDTFFNKLYEYAVDISADRIDLKVVSMVIFNEYLSTYLSILEINKDFLIQVKEWVLSENKQRQYIQKLKVFYARKPPGKMNDNLTSKATPTLDLYGTYLPNYEEFVNNMVIGKDEIIDSIKRIVQDSSSSVILLVGRKGIGKSTILNYLSVKIVVDKDFLTILKNQFRVILVDLHQLFIDLDSVPSKFYSVFTQIMKEAGLNNNVILFFDKIDNLFNVDTQISNEFVNIFITCVENYMTRVIATADYETYAKYMKQNAVLNSFMQTIYIPEPDDNQAFLILAEKLEFFEKKYKVNINLNVIKRIIQFKDKYDFDTVMPLKGVKFLEEVILYGLSKKIKTIDKIHVDELISKKTGINLGYFTEDEAQRLANLENEIRKRFVGQEEAVKSICSVIRRARSGLLENKNKPLASFLFYGPTGVGKTELTKVLAEIYYGSVKSIVRLDMSEYQEDENLNRLIGGIDENGNFYGGFLVESIRKNPFGILLLDEIEKANFRVLDLFLQILDEGYVNDALGRKTDFRNTIIIATTNVGSQVISQNIDLEYEKLEKIVFEELKKFFRIEFLNRFDKLIMFKHLTISQFLQVVQIQLNNLKNILSHKGITLEWDINTVIYLSKLSYNKLYGARQVKRVIQEEIENLISNLILSKKLTAGQKIIFKGKEYEISD